jgi:hypothetical protein
MTDRKFWISITLMAIAAGLILFALFGIAGSASSEPPVACIDTKTRDRIRELSLNAIDQALHAHVVHLYDIWLKDFSPEPQRAMLGMANGINAYQRARANALAWNPVICE